MALERYIAKRDFARTREPAGRVPARRAARQPLFVVQKHAARRLHYDFRLEIAGVLKSWAVPKGFPTRRGDRRLAIEVEDHPFEYAGFEGTIAPGNYGAGTVMVWDTGTYEAGGGDPRRAFEEGRLHLLLRGKKLKGEWSLVRMRPRESEDKPQWLLLKSGEDLPPFSERAETRSALTGRTMEQIARADDNQWESNRAAGARVSRAASPPSAALAPEPAPAKRASKGKGRAKTAAASPAAAPGSLSRALPAHLPKAKPDFVAPMKATLGSRVPEGPDWLYEIKFDGVRALAIKLDGQLRLLSRNAKDFSAKYAELLEPLARLPARQAVLDGEIVAVDPEGRSSFELLQRYQSAGANKPPLLYYVFDLLNLEGKDLSSLPLWQRKELARKLLEGLSPQIRFSGSIRADTKRVVQEMQRRGLEGLIAKQKESRYLPGQRTGAWVKFKWTLQQEFVIGGYTPPQGTRGYFGSVLVGYYQAGRLVFAAKVGTGFDETLLASMHQRFQRLIRPGSPFANLPARPSRGSRGGLTPSQIRSCTWLEPKLVCEVRFTEWTRDGRLRQPVFLGLREDKPPREVVRESP